MRKFFRHFSSCLFSSKTHFYAAETGAAFRRYATDPAETDNDSEKQLQQFHHRLAQNQKTELLLQSLRHANTEEEMHVLISQFKDHLMYFPHTRITAYKNDAIKDLRLLHMKVVGGQTTKNLRITLAMLGLVEDTKCPGVRILAIDGGGCKGIVSIQIIRKLVEISGKPLHEMFDYICGVSSGAVIGFMCAIMKLSVDETEKIHRDFGARIFSQNAVLGMGKLFISHAFYDTEVYQMMLKEIFGDTILVETAADITAPKCSAISVVVNGDVMKPFLWRNYSMVPCSRGTHWPGTCRATLWEAMRASSAAPGYFEEFKHDDNIHQDGGILSNNPSAIGLFECRSLWPDTPVQCMVSLGTGRYEPFIGPKTDLLSMKSKILKILDSACGTSEVHEILHNLLPKKTYFRFNPYLREQLYIDECRPEKLEQLIDDTNFYILRNKLKF